MPRRCDRCRKDPVIFLRYSGQHLCAEHFLSLLRRRVRRESRSQGTLSGNDRIGVAVSGGKDSLLALRLMAEMVEPFRNKSIVAITVDEGISGYRPSSVALTEKVTKDLDIQWELYAFKDLFGIDLDQMVARSKTNPCTICGILRRQALNRAALASELDILVTGHNLDDMAQTVLMNVLGADVQRFARLGPHLERVPGFVPRSMVLRSTPETETYLAAHLMGLPIHGIECPYSVTAHRRLFMDILMRAERDTPGTRHSLLRFHEQVSPMIKKAGVSAGPCSVCSEPVIGAEGPVKCRSCELLEEMGVLR